MAINPIGAGGGFINVTKKVARDYSNFVFGTTQSDVFANRLQTLVRGTKDATTGKYVGGAGLNGLKGNIADAWKTSLKAVEGKSFWQVTKESFSSMGGEFKAAQRLAKNKGIGKFFGASKKILGKRMPFIGVALTAIFELPNIFKAFTDKQNGGGIATGVAETGKAAIKLGAFAAGSAIGQALIPIPLVGALIGGMVAGIIADKIVGKSFTEKAEAKMAKAAEEEQKKIKKQELIAQNTVTAAPTGQSFAGNTYSSNPFATNNMSNIDYMNQDIMSMGLFK